MRSLLLALTATVLAGVSSFATATTPIQLTTATGVCTFNADTYTTSPLSAKGAFGPGCPGYVPPVTTPPPTTPPTTSTCPTPVFATRQQTLGVKFGVKPSIYNLQSADQVFNADPLGLVAAFPWAGNRAVSMMVNASQYVALPFTVPSNISASMAGRFGFFDTNYIGSPAFPPGNGVSYSVSQCPGDFSTALPAACKAQWNGQDGGYITVVAPEIADPTNALCKLQRGKTYYLNIIDAGLTAPITNKCTGSACTASIAYFRLQ
jgi:hypothetical protein